MKKQLLILFCTLLGLIAYFVVAGTHYSDQQRANVCTRIEIVIPDTVALRFVTRDSVLGWLAEAHLTPLKKPLHSIPTDRIESFLRNKAYVSTAQVHADMTGVVTIHLTQRHPQLRFMSENGLDFYIDTTLTTLIPSDKYAPTIPVVTGYLAVSDTTFQKIIEKNAYYFKNLINFVNKVQSDETLAALITQIYITETGELELVPRIGSQLILFGKLDETYLEKLQKMKNFYSKTFKSQWWTYAQAVDVKYNKQILLR